MKVIHLTTTTSGGAGRAAVRSVSALKSMGVDAELLSRDEAKEQLLKISRFRGLKFSAMSSVITLFQRLFIQNSEELVTALSTDLFQKNRQFIKFLEGFDVVHFHASYNFFNPGRLLNLLGEIPIVVTLHDQRFLTGGCHYSTNCQRFKSNCSNCPKVSLLGEEIVQYQREAMSNWISKSNSQRLHLVAPSTWMQNQIKAISEYNEVASTVVYNCVPSSFFQESIESSVTSKEFRVGVIATDIFNPYKGYDFFCQGVSHLNKKHGIKLKILLVTNTNKRNIPNLDENTEVVFPKDDHDYLQILDSLSVVCVPSSSDNSPNVIAESLARGVTVVTSNSGGVGEIPSKLGLKIFEFGDLEGFCDALMIGLSKSRLSTEQQALIRNIASEKTHASELRKIYDSMI
jgi:glycosyltransferase involved in cell wall biosynthesis